MTLERLLEKQQGLNSLLGLHLTDVENTICKLLGEDIIPKKEDITPPVGLLNNLDWEQEKLEMKIDVLNTLKKRLENIAFETTVSLDCAKIRC